MSEPNDPLLRALGEVERDLERRHPGEWEDVLAGRASAEATAARRAALDPPDEHAAFSAMFGAPIDEAEVERLVARASQQLAAPAAAPTPANVAPLRRKLGIAVAAVLAIAAALVLWRLPGEAPRGAQIAYALTVRNQAIEPVRSSDPAPGVATYRGDSEIDWVLSPETATTAAVTLRAIARADGRALTLTPTFTRSPAGALRLRGRLDEALPGLPPGRWQLRFTVDGREVGAPLEILRVE